MLKVVTNRKNSRIGKGKHSKCDLVQKGAVLAFFQNLKLSPDIDHKTTPSQVTLSLDSCREIVDELKACVNCEVDKNKRNTTPCTKMILNCLDKLYSILYCSVYRSKDLQVLMQNREEVWALSSNVEFQTIY